MAPITIKYVVSFSSQDENYPVNNIVKSSGFKRWLSNPKDKTGQLEAVFQLEDLCSLEYIDVGSFWCASLQILVGRSDWPTGTSFRTLVPTTCVMSPLDCRSGSSVNQTKMFQSDDFCQDVAGELWDRIQVICRQPFRRDVQFGLSFIHIRSRTTGNSLGEKSPVKKNVQSIQKHFGIKTDDGECQSRTENSLKSKLMKIAESSEHGSFKQESLSRTATLVLRSAEENIKSSPWAKTPQGKKAGLFSDHVAQKFAPTFQTEVDDFLKIIEIDRSQLDHITIADLRHKLEKRKKRKLSPDEKRVFKRKSTSYIQSLFSQEVCESEKSSDNTDSSQDLDLRLECTQGMVNSNESATSLFSERKLEPKKNSVISSYLKDVNSHTPSKFENKFSDYNLSSPNWNNSSSSSAKNIETFSEKKNVRHNDSIKFSCVSKLASAKKNREPFSSSVGTSRSTPMGAVPGSPLGYPSPNGAKSLTTKSCLNESTLPVNRQNIGGNSHSLSRIDMSDESISDDEFGSFAIVPKRGRARGRGQRRGKKPSLTESKKTHPRTTGRGRRRGNNRRNASRSSTSISVCYTVDEIPEMRQNIPDSPASLGMAYCNHCEGNFPESDFPHHFDVCPGPSSTLNVKTSTTGSTTSWTANYFGSLTAPVTLVECPICGVNFAADRIEVHAAVCLETRDVVTID